MMEKSSNSNEDELMHLSDSDEPQNKRRRVEKSSGTTQTESKENCETGTKKNKTKTKKKGKKKHKSKRKKKKKHIYANISNFEPKILFSHKDDNHEFNIIYSTLLSMNNLTKIFPNCLLQVIAFCATGTIIKCDGNCTNEILLIKSNQFLNFYKIYQSPYKSIVKLCIDCVSNDGACICQICHNKYPSNLIDIVELQGWRKGCIDCKNVWPKLSNLIEKIIVEHQDWASLTNGQVKEMLKSEFGKRTVKPFKIMIKKRIQQVVVDETNRREKKAPQKPPTEKEYYIQLRKIDAQICNPDMVEAEIEEMLTLEFEQLSKRDVQVIQHEIQNMRQKFEKSKRKKQFSIRQQTQTQSGRKLPSLKMVTCKY